MDIVTIVCLSVTCAVGLISMITVFLTRQNIINILSKDAIVFDQNYEIRKAAIEKAFKLLDDISVYGTEIISNPEFAIKARNAYSELICSVNNIKIVDEFFNLTLNKHNSYSETNAARFKLYCRRDLGLKSAKNQVVLSSTKFIEPRFKNQTVQSVESEEPKKSQISSKKETENKKKG